MNNYVFEISYQDKKANKKYNQIILIPVSEELDKVIASTKLNLNQWYCFIENNENSQTEHVVRINKFKDFDEARKNLTKLPLELSEKEFFKSLSYFAKTKLQTKLKKVQMDVPTTSIVAFASLAKELHPRVFKKHRYFLEQ